MTVVRKEGEGEEEYNKRVDVARVQIQQRMLTLIHAIFQVCCFFERQTFRFQGLHIPRSHCLLACPTCCHRQASLAAGLLQLAPLKPRTVGMLGVVASAMNCYFLMPPYPVLVAPAKAKVA